MAIKLLSYNIRRGGVGREKQISDVIRASGADIVVLQEATHVNVVERVAGESGMKFWGAKRDYSLGFLSRLEIGEHNWHELPELRRAFLELKLDGITVFGVHLSAVHSNWTERRRVRELHAMLRAVKQRSTGFHVLTGDFNTLAPGEDLDLRKLPPRLRLIAWMTGGKVRYETIQIMLDAGYVDGYRTLRYDKGFTFPTWDPHVRLDFIFLPSQSADRLAKCDVVCDGATVKNASDHFPLMSEITLETK